MPEITRDQQRKNQLENSARHICGYNKEYNVYGLNKNKEVLVDIMGAITRDMVVADMGCLDGSIAFEISQKCEHVYAFDLPEVIDKCIYDDSDTLTYIGIDFDKIFTVPREGRYNLILAMDVIEHLFYDKDFLVNCQESLAREGAGRMVISTPLALAKGTVNQDPKRQSHFREYTMQEILQLLDFANINIVDCAIEKEGEQNMIYIVGR